MATQTHLSMAGMQKTGLLEKMPSWFDQQACTFTENSKNVFLTFAKPCRCGATKQTAYVGLTKGLERATKLAACFVKTHGNCAPTSPKTLTAEEVLEASAAEIARLGKALKAQRRQVVEFEAQAVDLKRKVAQGDSDRTALITLKRLKTTAAGRQVRVDPENVEEFAAGMKSHCMLADAEQPGGILSTIEYWCRGSQKKLLTIVFDVIKRYDLDAQVAAELGAGADTVNKYIVQRLRAGLQELKKCGSERQRRDYRTVITAVAPEHGKAEPVAGALGLARRGKPFTDGIEQRAGIDETIESNKGKLAIGDLVHCRHGVGKLLGFDSQFDKHCQALFRA